MSIPFEEFAVLALFDLIVRGFWLAVGWFCGFDVSWGRKK